MTTNRDAAWVVATTLGIAAALLGLEHGAFETAQGNVAPGGLVISAIGPPCEPSTAWHACEPALTVVPDVLVGGVAAMGVALLVLVWVAFGLPRKHGGRVLFLLTIVLFLVGGGFVTLLIGTVAAFAGTHIGSRHVWWRTHVPTGATRSLARLWPWLLSIYLGWAGASWLVGAFFGDVMLRVTPAVTAATPVVLLLILAAAFARDILSEPSVPGTLGSPAP